MAGTTCWRKDSISSENEWHRTIWAWRNPTAGGTYREGMVILVGLEPTSGCDQQIHREDMTHEFQAYEIDPRTPVDLKKSLFEQPGLTPMMPWCVAFQFPALSNADADLRIGNLVDLVVKNILPVDIPGEWRRFFPEGLEVHRKDKTAGLAKAA